MKQKCERYTSSGRGMLNLFETVINAIKKLVKCLRDC
jgi:hypothetical protein